MAKAKRTSKRSGRFKKASPRKGTKALHNVRFPNESAAYRTARNRLLDAEIALRRETERIAALRRKLPAGGAIPVDYTFEELGTDGAPPDKGQNPRHVDAIWPLWNVFDFTPVGRGATWQPKLSYS